MSKRKAHRHARQINQAAKLYSEFTGEEPQYIDQVTINVSPVMLLIGECDGILYTTRRDGRVESYIHRFSKNARPLLTASNTGNQLYLIGGRYRFTDAGIIDC